MEAIRISCAGYPTRRTFSEFKNRFGILCPSLSDGSDDAAACKKLLEKVDLKGYQVGKTKVFLRAGQMAELDARRNQILGISAAIIQRKYLSYVSRRSFSTLRKSAVLIQAVCTGQLSRKFFHRLRREKASLMIQKELRMHLALKAYSNLVFAATQLQSSLRRVASSNELKFRRHTKAATMIQSHCRQFLAQLYYKRLKKAVVIAQCAWRRIRARRQLRKLKIAAREADALQAAKATLEKQVEELTLKLERETRMKAEMEEAKTQENEKLQSALQELQLQFNETKELLAKGKESAKQVAEKAPNSKESSVSDNSQSESVMIENEKLKDFVSSLEKKIVETEVKYEESMKQAMNAEAEILKLKNAMQRLEEKLSETESENRTLRQKSLSNSSVKFMPVPKDMENGHRENEVTKSKSASLFSLSSRKDGIESESKFRRSQRERKNESVEILFKCVDQNVGFSNEKSVAALTIYRCLIHWGLFEAEKTNVFDRLIQMIGSAIVSEENNEYMTYWLSTTSNLLFLLQKSFIGDESQKPAVPTTLFGRVAQGFRSSSNLTGRSNGIHPVKAEEPAMLFKMQLSLYVTKIYGIIRDNTKKELSNVLTPFIKDPGVSATAILNSSGDSQQSLWHIVIRSLNTLLEILQQNYVPSYLVENMFAQIFSYINFQLFNSLLMHRECCSFSNGENLKAGLDELEAWCSQEKLHAGSSWDELKHLRQAVGLLVLHQKSTTSYEDISRDLCPDLNVQQIYKICKHYWDDKSDTEGVNANVISKMEDNLQLEDNSNKPESILLEDVSGNPLSIEGGLPNDAYQENDMLDVKPPSELLDYVAFQFLVTEAHSAA